MHKIKILFVAIGLLLSVCVQAEEFHPFAGRHVLGELYGVEADLLNDADMLAKVLKEGIEAANATLCDTISKKFDPQGVTILMLIAESHVSIHTYPERNAIFFDAFTCGESNPEIIADKLTAALKPTHKNIQVIKRGDEQ